MRTGIRRSPRSRAAGRSSPAYPPRDPYDTSWLDEPIRRGRGLNPNLRWFWDQVPVRARTAILGAAQGKVRAWGGGYMPPTPTLREFITLPTHSLMATKNYARKTHADLCRAFSACGVAEPLFPNDE